MKKVLSLAILITMTSFINAQIPDSDKYLSVVNKTFAESNMEIIKPYLSADFTFGKFPASLGNLLMSKLVENLKVFKRTDLVSYEQKGDTTQYKLNINYSEPTRFIPVTMLVANNKICHITFNTKNIKDLEKGIPIQIPATNSYPFRLIKNMIVLDNVLINGFRGTFILDTGANATVLNSSTQFTYKTQKKEKAKTLGVHGTSIDSTAIIQVDSLCLGNVKWYNFTVTTSPLASTQKQLGLKELTGMLGASLLIDGEVDIDYVNKTLSFKSIDKDGNLTQPRKVKPQCTLPFSIVNGYATVLDVKIGNQYYKMMFDTGASGNVYSQNYYNQLKQYLKDEKTADLISSDDNKKQVRYAKMTDFHLGTFSLKETNSLFVNTPMATGTMIGIFGTDIVKDMHISINYKKQLFSIY